MAFREFQGFNMPNIINIRNLTYTIPHSDSILEDINFELGENEFVGILGHNGTGKTTLLDVILGLKKPSHGSIQVFDEDPHILERKNKEKIVFLSQDVTIKGNLSINDFLKFHSAFFPDYSHEDEDHLLRVFELPRDLKVGSLSTGQQKKVQVVAGLATRPKLIIVDEITAVMDPETRDIFFSELLKVREKYSSSVLLATNIAEDLMGRVDRVLFISDKKAASHSPEEIMSLFNIGEAA